MKRILTAIALMISVCAAAQTRQQRTVGDFTGISGATGIEIELTQGSENSVAVSAGDDSYLENIKTVVEKGILKIYFDNDGKKMNKFKNRKLKAFVTYKSINKLMGGSGSSFTATNTMNVPSLLLDMSSGASFKGDVTTKELEVDQSSGAISKVSGTATWVKADVSSGGIFTGTDLSSETCKVSASSGGILKIGVSKKLTADASSGGVVNYKGSPDVQKSTSSGGVVSKI